MELRFQKNVSKQNFYAYAKAKKAMSRRHSAYIPSSVKLPLFIYRFNQVFNFHIYHLPVFHSFASMSLLPSGTTSGILRNYYFFRATSRLIQDRDQSIKIQFSAPNAPIKLIVRFSKIRHLHAGLSTNQTRHAKNCSRSITWKCPQHGTGIAEIIIPPPSVYELPSRPSAAGKPRSVFKNSIRH